MQLAAKQGDQWRGIDNNPFNRVHVIPHATPLR
jgi:hypothetical protein